MLAVANEVAVCRCRGAMSFSMGVQVLLCGLAEATVVLPLGIAIGSSSVRQDLSRACQLVSCLSTMAT